MASYDGSDEAEGEGDDAPTVFLRPTRTPSLKNVHFIGPYGHRVSFASQQRRALNTIWALFETKKLRPKSKVAVIGAGLAGVTAAAGLLAKGCIVQLYEKEGSALQTQARARHRLLHPTVNFWPGTPLKPDTKLPFFDWASGPCDDIVADLLKEWVGPKPMPFRRGANGQQEEGFEKRLQVFNRNFEVARLEQDGDVVRVIPVDDTKETKAFELVLVTIGFGEEPQVVGARNKSYWDDDQLEEAADSALKTFLVSGTGDGGLIDTLRILHSQFDDGELTIGLAQTLSEGNLTDPIEALEAEAADILTGDPVNGRNRAADRLAEGYRLFVSKEMPEEVVADLDRSLRKVDERRVLLVGRLPKPFSPGAAPIHKLLIAHALWRKALDYEQKELDSSGGQLVLLVDGKPPEPIAPGLAIARHGADRPLKRFIPNKAEREDLEQRQSAFSDLLRMKALEYTFFDHPKHPPLDPASLRFVRHRRPKAAAYISRMYGLNVVVGAKDGEPVFEAVHPEDPGREPPDLPKRLFGVEVTSRAQEAATSAKGKVRG
jgi:hypothetical protein